MFTTSMPLSPAYVSASTVGLGEEVPRVLTGAQVHERDVRRDTGDAEPVDRRTDRGRDVRAVTVLVDVRRVVAGVVGFVLARAVDLDAVRVEGDVDGEVPAQLEREVRLDVGVVTVDAGVDDADERALVTLLDLVRTVDRRVHLLHVPLQIGERLGVGRLPDRGAGRHSWWLRHRGRPSRPRPA